MPRVDLSYSSPTSHSLSHSSRNSTSARHRRPPRSSHLASPPPPLQRRDPSPFNMRVRRRGPAPSLGYPACAKGRGGKHCARVINAEGLYLHHGATGDGVGGGGVRLLPSIDLPSSGAALTLEQRRWKGRKALAVWAGGGGATGGKGRRTAPVSG
uniref:Uncharacterized protein n=1 Tax=Oryza sativa subsp. japonica TaxID=39947 RepID=Q6Z4K0_ORYSJ|nr:hypothetical protein [Oryza sativa Japonica Group]